MIGRLSGKLAIKNPPELLIEVNGVGYEVSAPMSTIYQLPEQGQPVVLYTHFVVREDAQLLYAFATEKERSLFRALIKVNGIGPKIGLAVLSSLTPDTFVQCVSDGDVKLLAQTPGVGKKTAERLIVEMRDKLLNWDSTHADAFLPNTLSSTSTFGVGSAQKDAIDALVSLGYKAIDISKTVAKLAKDQPSLTSEAIIRAVLQKSA
jgi:Holliday junction DNA helicase RuvA